MVCPTCGPAIPDGGDECPVCRAPLPASDTSAQVVTRKGRVLLCGTCMDARSLKAEELVEGSRRSTLDELTELTATAEKALVF